MLAFVEPADSSVAISLSADPDSQKVLNLINLIPPKQTNPINDSPAHCALLDICCYRRLRFLARIQTILT
jgi:hypothetical protein